MEGEAAQAQSEIVEAPVTDASAGGGFSDTQPGAAVAEDTVGQDAGEDAAASPPEDAADLADLAWLPEGYREQFKELPADVRKAFYERGESRAAETLTQKAQEASRLKAEATRREDEAKEIRSRLGKFTGLEAREFTFPDGEKLTVPAYDELVAGLQSRAGRDRLFDTYGLTEGQAEFVRDQYDERGGMLEAHGKHYDDRAWARLDQNLKDGMRANGLDPDQILTEANNPSDVIRLVVAHTNAKHDAEKKTLADKVRLGDLNAEGMRARVAAGETRQLATGGRSSGGGPAALTPEVYAAMPYDERMKLRSTPEGRARIDAMTSGRR